MTQEYTRTFVGYGPDAQSAVLAVIDDYSAICEEFDVSPQEITMQVHMVADAEMSGTFVATAHLLGLDEN
ncbi:MAG TPA: hypothetical protein VIG24_06240 [Acidimicrobiia bacterium]